MLNSVATVSRVPLRRRFSQIEPNLAFLFGRRLTLSAFLLALTIGNALPSHAQVSDKLYLKSEAPLTGVTYQFIPPSARPSDEKPLPAPAADSWLALEVPAEFRRSGVLVRLLDAERGRSATFSLGQNGRGAQGLFRNSSALFEGNLLPEADAKAQEAKWSAWASQNATTNWRQRFRPGTDLLTNGRFVGGTTGWRPSFIPPADAEAQIVQGALPRGVSGSILRVVVNQKGPTAPHVQWVQEGLRFTEGRPYTMTFWARADRDRVAKLHIQHERNILRNGKNEWPHIGLFRTVSLTKDWRRYSFTFLAMNLGETHKLGFTLGDEIGWVEIAGTALRSGVDPALLESAQPVVGRTLTANSFDHAISLQVPLEFQGQGVANVRVSLQSEGRSLGMFTLTERDNGVARFNDVPIGKRLDITVRHSDQTFQTDAYLAENAPAVQQKTFILDAVQLPTAWTGVKTVAKAVAPAPITPDKATPIETVAPAETSNFNLKLAALAALLVVGGAIGGVLFTLNRRNKPQPVTTHSAMEPTTAIVTTEARKPFVFATPESAEQPSALPVALNAATSGGATPNGPHLVGIHGYYAGYTFPIRDACAMIGRDKGNAIALVQDDTASRRHANIELVNRDYLLTDEGSSNGVFVNGVRLPSQGQHVLQNGDEIEIGRTTFRFEV